MKNIFLEVSLMLSLLFVVNNAKAFTPSCTDATTILQIELDSYIAVYIDEELNEYTSATNLYNSVKQFLLSNNSLANCENKEKLVVDIIKKYFSVNKVTVSPPQTEREQGLFTKKDHLIAREIISESERNENKRLERVYGRIYKQVVKLAEIEYKYYTSEQYKIDLAAQKEQDRILAEEIELERRRLQQEEEQIQQEKIRQEQELEIKLELERKAQEQIMKEAIRQEEKRKKIFALKMTLSTLEQSERDTNYNLSTRRLVLGTIFIATGMVSTYALVENKEKVKWAFREKTLRSSNYTEGSSDPEYKKAWSNYGDDNVYNGTQPYRLFLASSVISVGIGTILWISAMKNFVNTTRQKNYLTVDINNVKKELIFAQSF